MRVLQDGGFQQKYSIWQVSPPRLLKSLFERVGHVLVRIICVEVVTLSAKEKEQQKKNRDSGNVSFSPPYLNANEGKCPAQWYI